MDEVASQAASTADASRYAASDTRDPNALEKQIVEVSLSTNVLSRFTAYVAVDRSEVVNKGGQQERVVQPVEAPDGTAARPKAPDSRRTSAYRVGLPRESRISRACTDLMLLMLFP